MTTPMTADEVIKDRLEIMLRDVDYEGEVIEDVVGYLEEEKHPEELDLLFVRAARMIAKHYKHPDWQESYSDWHYWTPQLVAGELDLKRLPEGAVRELARELYYGGKK